MGNTPLAFLALRPVQLESRGPAPCAVGKELGGSPNTVKAPSSNPDQPQRGDGRAGLRGHRGRWRREKALETRPPEPPAALETPADLGQVLQPPRSRFHLGGAPRSPQRGGRPRQLLLVTQRQSRALGAGGSELRRQEASASVRAEPPSARFLPGLHLLRQAASRTDPREVHGLVLPASCLRVILSDSENKAQVNPCTGCPWEGAHEGGAHGGGAHGGCP